MSNTRTSNSIKNSGAAFFGRIATMLMEFVLRTVLIKRLGIEYGGVSTLFTDTLQILSLMELGLGSAIIYALYKPLADGNNRKINALMHFYKTAYNIIAAGVFLLGLLCVPFMNYIVKDVPDIKEDIRLIFVLYVAASASSYLVIYKETLIRASQRSRIAVMIEMIVQLVFMGIEALVLLIFKNYYAYLVLRIVTFLVRNVLISLVVRKLFPEVDFRSADRLTKDERQDLVKDIGAMSLYKISGAVLNSTDSIVVSAFIGTGVVGVLGQYRMFSNFLTNISNKIWNSVLPSVGNLAAVDSPDRQYAVYQRISFGNYLFSAFCAVAMFLLMNPLVSVWLGEEYTISTVAAAIIAFNLYLILIIYPFQTFRDANGLFVQGKYRPLIMSIINVLLSLALVRPFGMEGVLIATPISRLATQIWFDPCIVYKYVFKRSPKSYFIELAQHMLLMLVCAVGIGVLLHLFHFTNGFLELIVGAVLCVILIPAVYLLIFWRNPQCKQLLTYARRMVGRTLRR